MYVSAQLNKSGIDKTIIRLPHNRPFINPIELDRYLLDYHLTKSLYSHAFVSCFLPIVGGNKLIAYNFTSSGERS